MRLFRLVLSSSSYLEFLFFVFFYSTVRVNVRACLNVGHKSTQLSIQSEFWPTMMKQEEEKERPRECCRL